MRAAIPAFVLLFIGVVTAIPFRRPSPSLQDEAPRSSSHAPQDALPASPLQKSSDSLGMPPGPTLYPLPTPSVLQQGEAHVPAAGRESFGFQTPAELLPAAPVNPAYVGPHANRYDEVTVPLQKFPVPSVPGGSVSLGSGGQRTFTSPQEIAGQSVAGNTPSGVWQQGIEVGAIQPGAVLTREVELRELARLQAATTQTVPFDLNPREIGTPPHIAETSEKGRTPASTTSAPANLTRASEAAPGDAQPRVRHFIREPQAVSPGPR